MALAQGIAPASIQGLYEAAGKGLYRGITVPAINIRGLTYHVARAVFRAALRRRSAPSSSRSPAPRSAIPRQRPAEYAACVLAAAVREGLQGAGLHPGRSFPGQRRQVCLRAGQGAQGYRGSHQRVRERRFPQHRRRCLHAGGPGPGDPGRTTGAELPGHRPDDPVHPRHRTRRNACLGRRRDRGGGQPEQHRG